MTDSILIMLVLFNPLLMAAFLHPVMNQLSFKVFFKVVLRAFVISGFVFLLFAAAGDALFTRVLQVRFASFLIFGGILFLIIGIRSFVMGASIIGELRGEPEQLSGSIAMPFMIGPGTISASVLIGSRHSLGLAFLAILISLSLSCLFLMIMKRIYDIVHHRNERLIERYIDIVGRASALIIGTIAVEMILNGIDLFRKTL